MQLLVPMVALVIHLTSFMRKSLAKTPGFVFCFGVSSPSSVQRLLSFVALRI